MPAATVITTRMITTTDGALLRLLQLSSAALPVGGYAFSQGMEAAVEAGWLKDEADSAQWLGLQLQDAMARVDLPLLLRQVQAARAADWNSLCHWNAYTLACRESAELRLADTAMGEALVRLLGQLEVPLPETMPRDTVFLTTFALAGVHWELGGRATLLGYTWAWLENQVAAATKLVPLGQGSAQRLLGEMATLVPAVLDCAQEIADEDIGASLPGLAMASGWHETQYSRLFRS